MGIILSIIVFIFCAILVLGVGIFLVIDMHGKIDYLKEHIPWLVRFVERRESHGILLLLSIFLLIGNGYELFVKDVPEVPEPPRVTLPLSRPPTIANPRPPKIITKTIAMPDQPLKIRTVEFGVDSQMNGKPGISLTVVGITNKSISPVDATLGCDQDIQAMRGPSLGGQRMYLMKSMARIDARSYRLKIGSPAWTQESPLAAIVFTEAKDIVCELRQTE